MAASLDSPAHSVDVPHRLVSLDAYRGLVMVAIAANGLGIAKTAQHFSDSAAWQQAAYQFEHVSWVGCSFWDLIQPSFMFMVGVAMAYSYAKRASLGQSYAAMFRHAVGRSVVLVLLGVFLSSNWSKQTNFTFVNVLAQIGLGYTFLFLLWGRRPIVQFAAAVAILIGYWGWFALHPVPSAGYDLAAAGLPADWPHLAGFAAHWNKNANAAAAFDQWFLNLFPRPEPFVFNQGGYQTLNFVPSLATMIFGLMVGELMRSQRSIGNRLAWLIGAGVAGLVIGQVLNVTGVCPLVKRIWTPSWAVFSTGWTCLLLAAFYGVIDVWKFRTWAFPLVVVGMNSMAMYLMSQLLKPWTGRTLGIHLGDGYEQTLGVAYAPIVQSVSVVLIFWLACYWLYRQRVFLRV